MNGTQGRRSHPVARVAGALLLGVALSAAAQRPPVTRFRPDVDVFPQYFTVALSADRLVYVGAIEAVLRFDGARWTTIPMPKPSAVRALHLDRHGRLWAGGAECFGYLERTPTGSDRFVNVAPGFAVHLAGRRFGEIWEIHERDDGIYLRGVRDLFHVDHAGAARRHWHHPGRFGSFAEIGGRMVMQWRGEGLRVLEGDAFVPLPGGEAFPSPIAYNLFALDEHRLLVHDLTPRLVLWHGGKVQPFDLGDHEPLLQHAVNAIRLDPTQVAFAGDDGVIRVLDLERRRFHLLAIGGSHVSTLGLDPQGALWAATADTVVRVPWPSEWLIYDAADGLRGTVHAVEIAGTRLYALTGAGVYEAAFVDGRPRGPFVHRPWTVNEVWALIDDGDRLLLAESYGIVEIAADGSARTIGPDDLYPRTMLRSPFSADRIWIGTEDGVALLARGRDGWSLRGAPAALDALALTLVEPAPGEVWVGSENRGVIRARFDVVSGALLESRPVGAGEGIDYGTSTEGYLSRLGERMWVTTQAGLFRRDGERFARDDVDGLGQLLEENEAVDLYASGDGVAWALGTRSVYRRLPGEAWRSIDLSSVDAPAFESIYPLPGGRALFTLSGALLHFDGQHGTAPQPAPAAPAVRIMAARLEAGKHRRELPMSGAASMPYDGGALVLDLGLTDYGSAKPPQFQVRLLGLDSAWSPWREGASVSYAALAPGTYRFEARGRRLPQQVTGGATLELTVVPRWYQWQSVQGLLATVAIALLVLMLTWRQRVRMRRLAALNLELDSQVQARTLELEALNARLRELAERDGLTGVANRRRFDEALAERFAQAQAGALPISLLLVDVDRFKAYNDSHGHLAGDELLQRVSACLREVVREDTLVARYGGEEFALIAAACDTAQAGVLGERLRAIVAEALPGTTISVGTATYAAADDATPSDLVGRADAALYRAKRGGRNRVEQAEAPSISSAGGVP